MADTQLIDAVHSMRHVSLGVCREIESVAMLLDEVGLTKIASRLFRTIPALQDASAELNAAYGDSLQDNLNYSQAMTGNLLILALSAAAGKPEAA